LASTAIASISVHHLAIPLKHLVKHAASTRSVADASIVGIELQNGTLGYGETLPRVYVTGEDHESVDRAVRELFVPLLVPCHPESFSEALELIEALPMLDSSGSQVPAARAAVELALLDVYSRYFQRPIAVDVVNWLGFSDFGPPGSIEQVRCSGVIATTDPSRAARSVRKMRCFGLREFKLKVGKPDDGEMVAAVAGALANSIRKGRCMLRLDSNGAWSLNEAVERLSGWSELGLRHIEQPLAKGDEENLQDLKAHTGWEIIHDESVVSMEDAERLRELGVADCFNIRLSKCGGFIPSLKLAHFCRRHGIDYMLGCMVGQTSILSAAERCFLSCVPGVKYVESNVGSFLIADDVARPKLRFGYGGKLKPLAGFGWGVIVDQDKLTEFSEDDALRIRL